MKIYEVTVDVHNAPKTSKTFGPVKQLTYFVRADSVTNAKVEALNNARLTQVSHPRKYKGATFTVAQENVKLC